MKCRGQRMYNSRYVHLYRHRSQRSPSPPDRSAGRHQGAGQILRRSVAQRSPGWRGDQMLEQHQEQVRMRLQGNSRRPVHQRAIAGGSVAARKRQHPAVPAR